MENTPSPKKGRHDHVLVQVLGEEFRIDGEDPAKRQRVEKAVEYLRRKERELLTRHGNRLSKNKAAVLVALEVTAELLSLIDLVKRREGGEGEGVAPHKPAPITPTPLTGASRIEGTD
jgi:cell division protein ZapA (FtsZ GTPase activity inhibitor)